jgi:predicted O-methyltransferase YrrM
MSLDCLTPIRSRLKTSSRADTTKCFVNDLNRDLKIYVSEAKKLRKESPSDFHVWRLIRDFPTWYRSLHPAASPISERTPWITYGAIRFLAGYLKSNMRAYEYGTGGSTIFFAGRCREVFSCEHDPDWAEKVREALAASTASNAHIEVREPVLDAKSLSKDPSDPDAYVSHSPSHRGFDFRWYVESIDQFPDEHFDVVLIDGRARPSCAKHAIPKVAKGGRIILDNAERGAYLRVYDTKDAFDNRREINLSA